MSDTTLDTIHRTADTFISTLETDRLGDSTLVAAMEQLETASVDPTKLTGDQTVQSVEDGTLSDLDSFSQSLASQNSVLLSEESGGPFENYAAILVYEFYEQGIFATETDAALFTPGDTPPPVPYVAPPAPEMFGVIDTTINSAYQAYSTSYTGPVAGLQNQFVELGPDNVNITATQPNNFICGGAGDDAIDVSAVGGTNVLDGGGGSNFLTGGSGLDTFFVEPLLETTDSWNTVVGFHAGDAVTLWGVSATGSSLDWADGEGAANATGLTLHAAAPGGPIDSLTLAGYRSVDLGNGRLTIDFGADTAGTPYMYIHANGF